MFDAKSILDALVRSGGQQQRPQEDLSGISDLLKQLSGADQGKPDAEPRATAAPRQVPDVDDVPEERAPTPPRRQPMPREDHGASTGAAQGGGGLDDNLGHEVAAGLDERQFRGDRFVPQQDVGGGRPQRRPVKFGAALQKSPRDLAPG